ncbi:MAG: DNA topoisomerase 3 [Clostridia bacterium]|jgi:DNA topoisomerase-3|nr:DNA topoisomerase 3 [Clostridia bacterium]
MGKILVIAEKPSVAKDIAKVLNSNQRGDGYYYGENYIVSWAVGHLITLKSPEEYNVKYKKWKIEDLPIIPEEMELETIGQTKKQFIILEKLIKNEKVDSLICATDSGREGELIFRYIYEKVGVKKPFKRLWISSMTDESIKNGFDNLKEGKEYDNLYYSAKSRSEADWLVGMNASRLFTVRYNSLLPIGRVQTPTLGILAERENEIKNFKPQDYYEIKVKYNEFESLWINIKENDSKILSIKEANKIFDKVKNKSSKVENIEKELKKINHPLLYDLTELQRDGNKKFGFSADRTLKIVQSLYEKRKMVTYPRTDSRHLSDDMIPIIKSTVSKLSNTKYSDNVKYIESLDKLPITKRIVDNKKVTDHHAIIPTNVNPKINLLGDDEAKIYDLIVKRFLCVFYPKYEYETTKIFLKSEGEDFISQGRMLKKLGWKEVYKGEKDDDTDKLLPVMKKDDVFENIEVEIITKKTKAPSFYNEATLLSAMENAGKFVEDEEIKEKLKESGLGTPATRANIIERLISVKYVKREKKNLRVTEKGMKLISVVPKELKSPITTGKWEKGLNQIAKGNMEMEKFMGSIYRYVNYLVDIEPKLRKDVYFKNESKIKAKGGLGKCPSCEDGRIFENSKAYFCSNWKNGCKYSIWKNALENYKYELTNEVVEKLLKNKKLEEKVSIVMPQTGEKAAAELVLEGGNIKFLNIDRVD